MMAEAKTPAELKRIYLGEGDVKGLLQFVSDEKAVRELFGSLLKRNRPSSWAAAFTVWNFKTL